MTASTHTVPTSTRGAASIGRRALAGTIGGAAGGIVFGALMAMMFGMTPFTFDATTLPSLMGHIVYGAILGVVASRIIAKRR